MGIKSAMKKKRNLLIFILISLILLSSCTNESIIELRDYEFRKLGIGDYVIEYPSDWNKLVNEGYVYCYSYDEDLLLLASQSDEKNLDLSIESMFSYLDKVSNLEYEEFELNDIEDHGDGEIFKGEMNHEIFFSGYRKEDIIFIYLGDKNSVTYLLENSIGSLYEI